MTIYADGDSGDEGDEIEIDGKWVEVSHEKAPEALLIGTIFSADDSHYGPWTVVRPPFKHFDGWSETLVVGVNREYNI